MTFPNLEDLSIPNSIMFGVSIGIYWIGGRLYKYITETSFQRKYRKWHENFDESTQSSNMALRELVEELDKNSLNQNMLISSLTKDLHDCQQGKVDQINTMQKDIKLLQHENEQLKNKITEYEAENYIRRKKER